MKNDVMTNIVNDETDGEHFDTGITPIFLLFFFGLVTFEYFECR